MDELNYICYNEGHDARVLKHLRGPDGGLILRAELAPVFEWRNNSHASSCCAVHGPCSLRFPGMNKCA